MIDAILSWPRGCDHPAWRQFVRDNRERFARVIVVLTEHDAPHDYTAFLREAAPEIEFLDSPDRGDRDWRDVAVNYALDQSRAEWVWFTEQDFLIGDWPDFTADAYGFAEGNGRWHPASLFVRRALIDRTTRYFGTPPVDHFWTFSQELDRLTTVVPLTGYRHFQAITESQLLVATGHAPRFRPEQYREWLAQQLTVTVPIDPTWRASVSCE